MPETEELNPSSRSLDALDTKDVLSLMLKEESKVTGALKEQLPAISLAVEDAVAAIRSGGKVYYAGAGTSGRLGVLDAAEIRPTFGRDCFRAVIAGGRRAIRNAVEGAEDDTEAAKKAAVRLKPRDMAVGITASGTTPFAIAFLEEAARRGAPCWLITSSKGASYGFLRGAIRLITGPELIAGSTRLKAATATKVALNMLSTATMVRLGGVYDGLMVDVVPSNRKLIKRATDIITDIARCTPQEAAEALRESGMKPKVAALMLRKDLSKARATRLLKASGGSLRKALGGPQYRLRGP